ncbi:MAG: polyhydroxyalkanoic acid system family protein [Pseudomonadota bacterium]|jgi:putative polyhydroxyalkanoate system protein|nr:polyhydroxyalkanoic acid system family protein [Marinobacter sp.]
MSVIDIHRSHSLDKQHARSAAETLAENLSRKFDMQYHWDGDQLKFERSGVKGRVDIAETDLHIRIELGMMLRPFKPKIEEEIQNRLDRLVAA